MGRGFRIAGGINEFLKDLDVLKETPHKLIVWQNDANGDKQIFDGVYDSYLKEKDRIIINVKLDKNEIFEKDNSVYIFEKDKGILFKGRYEFCVNSTLKVLADDKVFLKEKRAVDRFNFNYTKVSAKISFISAAGGPEINDLLDLKDVCAGGFSFKIAPKKKKQFKLDQEISLTEVGGIELPRAIEGKIAHISKFKSVSVDLDAQRQRLVGVKFNQDSKLFAKVISVIKAMN